MYKLIIILGILILSVPISLTQTFENEKYCSPADVSPAPLNISIPCLKFTSCVSENFSDFSCYSEAFAGVYDICQQTDRDDCVSLSAMYMVLMNAIVSAYDNDMTTTLWVSGYFEFGNFDGSLESLESYTNPSPAGAMAKGLVLSALGDQDGTVSAYTESLNMYSANYLVYYLRGQAYLELGDTERASQDFYNYKLFAPEKLLAKLPAPIPVFEMPNDSEVWFYYPVLSRSISPGGTFVTDRTIEPPVEIMLASTLDGQILAISNLADINPAVEDEILFFVQDPEDGSHYVSLISIQHINLLFSNRSSTRMFSLEFVDDYFELMEVSVGSEAGGQRNGILAPDYISDPRDGIDRPCDGVMMSWLEIGDTLQSVDEFAGLYVSLYTKPQIDADMFPDLSMSFMDWWREQNFADIVVTGGPECNDEQVWWEVTIADTTVWMRDNYLFLPDEVEALLYGRSLPLAPEVIAFERDDS